MISQTMQQVAEQAQQVAREQQMLEQAILLLFGPHTPQRAEAEAFVLQRDLSVFPALFSLTASEQVQYYCLMRLDACVETSVEVRTQLIVPFILNLLNNTAGGSGTSTTTSVSVTGGNTTRTGGGATSASSSSTSNHVNTSPAQRHLMALPSSLRNKVAYLYYKCIVLDYCRGDAARDNEDQYWSRAFTQIFDHAAAGSRTSQHEQDQTQARLRQVEFLNRVLMELSDNLLSEEASFRLSTGEQRQRASNAKERIKARDWAFFLQVWTEVLAMSTTPAQNNASKNLTALQADCVATMRHFVPWMTAGKVWNNNLVGLLKSLMLDAVQKVKSGQSSAGGPQGHLNQGSLQNGSLLQSAQQSPGATNLATTSGGTQRSRLSDASLSTTGSDELHLATASAAGTFQARLNNNQAGYSISPSTRRGLYPACCDVFVALLERKMSPTDKLQALRTFGITEFFLTELTNAEQMSVNTSSCTATLLELLHLEKKAEVMDSIAETVLECYVSLRKEAKTYHKNSGGKRVKNKHGISGNSAPGGTATTSSSSANSTNTAHGSTALGSPHDQAEQEALLQLSELLPRIAEFFCHPRFSIANSVEEFLTEFFKELSHIIVPDHQVQDQDLASSSQQGHHFASTTAFQPPILFGSVSYDPTSGSVTALTPASKMQRLALTPTTLRPFFQALLDAFVLRLALPNWFSVLDEDDMDHQEFLEFQKKLHHYLRVIMQLEENLVWSWLKSQGERLAAVHIPKLYGNSPGAGPVVGTSSSGINPSNKGPDNFDVSRGAGPNSGLLHTNKDESNYPSAEAHVVSYCQWLEELADLKMKELPKLTGSHPLVQVVFFILQQSGLLSNLGHNHDLLRVALCDLACKYALVIISTAAMSPDHGGGGGSSTTGGQHNGVGDTTASNGPAQAQGHHPGASSSASAFKQHQSHNVVLLQVLEFFVRNGLSCPRVRKQAAFCFLRFVKRVRSAVACCEQTAAQLTEAIAQQRLLHIAVVQHPTSSCSSGNNDTSADHHVETSIESQELLQQDAADAQENIFEALGILSVSMGNHTRDFFQKILEIPVAQLQEILSSTANVVG
ncbi:unnamed protein product, partial [Amoebophrya sp. A25]|eukprot:GSA25T00023185001.1